MAFQQGRHKKTLKVQDDLIVQKALHIYRTGYARGQRHAPVKQDEPAKSNDTLVPKRLSDRQAVYGWAAELAQENAARKAREDAIRLHEELEQQEQAAARQETEKEEALHKASEEAAQASLDRLKARFDKVFEGNTFGRTAYLQQSLAPSPKEFAKQAAMKAQHHADKNSSS